MQVQKYKQPLFCSSSSVEFALLSIVKVGLLEYCWAPSKSTPVCCSCFCPVLCGSRGRRLHKEFAQKRDCPRNPERDPSPCKGQQGVSILLRRHGGFLRRKGGFLRRGRGFSNKVLSSAPPAKVLHEYPKHSFEAKFSLQGKNGRISLLLTESLKIFPLRRHHLEP